jgi:predicted dehydrogenase
MKRRQFLKDLTKLGITSIAAPYFIPASVRGSANHAIAPSDRINLGMIGHGKQGSGLLRGFLYKPEVQVVAVCDVDSKKLENALRVVRAHSAEHRPGNSFKGCKSYSDFREILARDDIDAVVIATPDHWHEIPTRMAARAGKDIYCEKPLSLTIAEARHMVNEVRKYSRVFQTGSMQRSDQKFRFACELVRNGYIGNLETIRVSIKTGFLPHPVYCDLEAENVPDYLDWTMWLGPAPQRPFHHLIAPPITFRGWPEWRNYYDYSGGGMTDWGAHHIDIAQWGLGMDHSGPVKILPPNNKDINYLTYVYENGVILEIDFESNYVLFSGSNGKIQVNREYLKTWPESLLSVHLKPDEIHLYESNDHKANWLDCIRKRSRPICDVEIGCRSVTVCHLGNIAVQLDRPLKWDPVKEQFMNDEEANRMISRSRQSPWVV